jgi:hypothetical protein
VQRIKNASTIDNLLIYKYFYLNLSPFDLNLDGNFCDELYKYAADIASHANKYKMVKSLLMFNYIIMKQRMGADQITDYDDEDQDSLGFK